MNATAATFHAIQEESSYLMPFVLSAFGCPHAPDARPFLRDQVIVSQLLAFHVLDHRLHLRLGIEWPDVVPSGKLKRVAV